MKKEERLAEEAIYESISEELKSGVKRDGLWLKALAKAEGEEQKAMALYVELRKQSIIDELQLADELDQQAKPNKWTEETLAPEGFLTEQQYSKKYGLTEQEVRRLVWSGQVGFVKKGGINYLRNVAPPRGAGAAGWLAVIVSFFLIVVVFVGLFSFLN